MGDASPGTTKLRSCRGSANWAAKSSSLSESNVLQESDTSISSAPPSIDLVIARGKLGANTERNLVLSRRESRGGGSSDEDSEYVVAILLPSRERRWLLLVDTFADDCSFCLLFTEAREPCANKGLAQLVLARLRMNDCLFSCSDRSSGMLSLLPTSLILPRFSASVRESVGTDLIPPKVERVGGRGKSDGFVDRTLVPLVLKDATLLPSGRVECPRLLNAFLCPLAPRELCLGNILTPPVSIPKPTL